MNIEAMSMMKKGSFNSLSSIIPTEVEEEEELGDSKQGRWCQQRVPGQSGFAPYCNEEK